MSPSPSRNIALSAFILAFAASPQNSFAFSSSFVPLSSRPQGTDILRVAALSPTSSHRSRSRHLFAVDFPMRPMEDEREKNAKGKNNKQGEWKEVVGGFVPNFLKRAGTQDGIDSQKTAGYQIETVDTLEGYKKIVVDEADKIVVVRFFAPWCKSCKASAPLFRRLVSQYSSEVKFVESPLTKETAYIHEGLGVPSVPFAHIYHPDAGLVEEKKINKKVFTEFQTAFESYVRGSCDLPEEIEGESEVGFE